MKSAEVIDQGEIKRLESVLNQSWKIFKSKFLNRRFEVTKEAPFQHHFAGIIRKVGDLYCLRRAERFFVDLEVKHDKAGGKKKYIDIVCGFIGQGGEIKCSIELKFKTRVQGAEDHGQVDMYQDIKALEDSLKEGYSFAKFYMITDDHLYTQPARRGVRQEFNTSDGFEYESNKELVSHSKGREGVTFTSPNEYRFEWGENNGYYFLELRVPPSGAIERAFKGELVP